MGRRLSLTLLLRMAIMGMNKAGDHSGCRRVGGDLFA